MANLLELIISEQWQRGMLASAYAWSVPAKKRAKRTAAKIAAYVCEG
jgi:hypothetical protein